MFFLLSLFFTKKENSTENLCSKSTIRLSQRDSSSISIKSLQCWSFCRDKIMFICNDHRSRDMLNFKFLWKDLEIVSLLYFVCDFSRKIFLILHSMNWPDFIVWLPLLLEILGNMCIAIVCFSGCDVINFEIKLVCLIKPFFYMIKKLRKRFKYLENKKRF